MDFLSFKCFECQTVVRDWEDSREMSEVVKKDIKMVLKRNSYEKYLMARYYSCWISPHLLERGGGSSRVFWPFPLQGRKFTEFVWDHVNHVKSFPK